MTSINYLC